MKSNWLFTLLLSFLITTVFSQTRDTTYFIYQNLGSQVNSEYNESGPRISPDGSTLYFFRIDHPEDLKGSNDIWVSHVTKDSTWTLAERLGEPLNNFADNAVHSVSEDGNSLLVHDIYLKNKMSKSGLSITKKIEGQWSFPKPLKIKKYKNVNEICSFYLSDDWETLILAIETEETNGKQDLYVSFHNEANDTWSEPKNLGNTINSAGSEATAFLASDQKTLYFSSNGFDNSLGGVDIYKSIRLDDSWTNWSEPKNIGKPYNTSDDEFYFSIPAHAGGWAYLAHSHHHGHSDITRVKQVTEPLPDPIVFLSGHIYDDSTKQKIAGDVTFVLTPIDSIVGIVSADENKEYNITLKGFRTYKYTVHKEGYEDYEGVINLKDVTKDESRKLDLYLTPIYVPRKVDLVLEGLEFATAKWDIRDQYIPVLDVAYKYLLENPEYVYELSGHTDNVDTDEANKILSQHRADAVKEYLVKKGIEENRLIAVGYGESIPIATNDTDEGRQRNRRVELIKQK